MHKVVNKPEQHVNYYQKNMIRRVDIEWADEQKRQVYIYDYMETEVIPFDYSKDCEYNMFFTPTTGENIQSYRIDLCQLEIDGAPIKVDTIQPTIVDNQSRFTIPLRHKLKHSLKRKMRYTQCIDDDPIFVVLAGRGVVWGMRVLIEHNVPTLRVNFEEMGLEHEFKAVGEDRPNRIERQTVAALLPDQGFQIVLATAPQPPVDCGAGAA